MGDVGFVFTSISSPVEMSYDVQATAHTYVHAGSLLLVTMEGIVLTQFGLQP